MFTIVNVERVRLQDVSVISACSVAQCCGNPATHHRAVGHKAAFDVAAGGATDSRVALDGVLVADGGGGLRLCHMALEEGVAVGVGVLGGTDVGVERVGGRADRQLLWSHWLSCWDHKIA